MHVTTRQGRNPSRITALIDVSVSGFVPYTIRGNLGRFRAAGAEIAFVCGLQKMHAACQHYCNTAPRRQRQAFQRAVRQRPHGHARIAQKPVLSAMSVAAVADALPRLDGTLADNGTIIPVSRREPTTRLVETQCRRLAAPAVHPPETGRGREVRASFRVAIVDAFPNGRRLPARSEPDVRRRVPPASARLRRRFGIRHPLPFDSRADTAAV